LPDTKSGQKFIPVGAPTLELLTGLPRIEGSDYVLPGEKAGQHFVGLPKFWERIRKLAGLDDVRLHDLRHSFASVGAGAGLGLHIVGKLLGHRDPKTTARYAHVADDPARIAADRIAGTISLVMEGGTKADVISFKKGGKE
jgi:integrase